MQEEINLLQNGIRQCDLRNRNFQPLPSANVYTRTCVRVKTHFENYIFSLGVIFRTQFENLTCLSDISPALIAAIASRESRAGRLIKSTQGYGDRGNGYGIMQVCSKV